MTIPHRSGPATFPTSGSYFAGQVCCPCAIFSVTYFGDSIFHDNRKMCSLYLSLMDRFGLKVEQFGDSQTRLARL
jgi:hypothetical protein